MIKIIKDCYNKLSLKVEGEIKIDNSLIEPYEKYVKEEEHKQKVKAIYDMLLQCAPDTNDPCWFFRESFGHREALKKLANYLAENN